MLADLTTNADAVISELADNRQDVGRFVVEARDTAAASAERRVATSPAPSAAAATSSSSSARRCVALGRAVDAQTPRCATSTPRRAS